MKKLLLIAALIFTSLSINYPQTNKIGFDIDYSQFSFDPDSNLIEFYYLFDTASMMKIKEDSLLYVNGVLTITMQDTATHKLIINKQWQFKDLYSNSLENVKSLVGVLGFVVPRGAYECKFTGSNLNDSVGAVSYNEFIEVNPFISDKLNLSNIEMAGKIVPGSPNKTSMFYKNTYEVIPSPNVLFGDNQPALFYYFEMYNLNQATENLPLIMKIQVFSATGKLVLNREKYITHTQNSRVEVGNINVNKFPTNSYTLVISIIDSAKNYGVSSSKKFYVFNEAIPNNDTSYVSADVKSLSNQFFSLSEEQLDNLFEKSKYVAQTSEVGQYESLTTVEAKRTFLNDFWQKRDSNPSTPRNEYYEDYIERISYADKQFTRIRTPGWKTDRGRVYIQYGPPSEIDRFPNVGNSKPYEIWKYNEIEGGVEFIFADLTGLSDYQLLNSTKKGEINDPNWERRIKTL